MKRPPVVEFPSDGVDHFCIGEIFEASEDGDSGEGKVYWDIGAYVYWENEFHTRERWIFQNRVYDFIQKDDGAWYLDSVENLRTDVKYPELVVAVQRLPEWELVDLLEWVQSTLEARSRGLITPPTDSDTSAGDL